MHVVSIDEKTGIQALERIHADHAMSKGKLELHEFEYTRHGTQTLIANFEVATGKVICPTLGDTRTEDDFVAHIRATASTDPDAKWVFVADQLNTHKSASLVDMRGGALCIKEVLGEKDKSGILETMASRAAFLNVLTIVSVLCIPQNIVHGLIS